MIKVFFDINPIKSGHKTRGVGVYIKNLLKALESRDDVKLVDLKEADLIHYPFFDFFKYSVTFKTSKPQVVTIHDTTPLLFPRHYPKGIKGTINYGLQRMSLKNKVIITDSENSKKDINKILKIDLNKIFVTYLSGGEQYKKITDDQILKKVKRRYKLPEKYALYVGSVNWNKNLLNMAEAATKAGIDFVLIGKGFEEKENLNHPELKSFRTFLEKYQNNPKIHILGYVDDEDLVAITNSAQVFLFVSFYEGFGMPVLEAQKSGVPVITSNVSSLPEVVGDSALMIDPESVDDIVKAILKVTSDKVLRNDLIVKGLENVKRFSWEKTAKHTVEVYKYALKND